MSTLKLVGLSGNITTPSKTLALTETAVTLAADRLGAEAEVKLHDEAETRRSAARDLSRRLQPRRAGYGRLGVGLVFHQRQHARGSGGAGGPLPPCC